MVEIIDPGKIPEKLIPLYGAPTEQDVVDEAIGLLNSSDEREQSALLQDVRFLSIINQTLMGMDEDRDKYLTKIVAAFQESNQEEARRRFARLLELTER